MSPNTADHSEPASARLPRAVFLGGLLALVCLRSFVFVRYPQTHFDSDQAVYGLMAQDLAEGKALPLFMYGQRYLLAVSVWLTAPFFAVFGVSGSMLKLPIFLLNVVVTCLLWLGLRREPGSTPLGTSLAILPFALPGVVAGSRLLEHAGGNIEPFVFVLAAFLLRERPIALGVALALGFLNREFTILSAPALLLQEFLAGRTLGRLRPWLVTFGIAAAVVVLGRIAGRFGNEFHGFMPTTGRPALANIAGLVIQQLPTLIELRVQPLSKFNLTSTLVVGHHFVLAGLVLFAAVVVRALIKSPPTRTELGGMSTFLILVGAGQIAGFVLLTPAPYDAMLVRYILLALLVPVGLFAYAWRRKETRFWVAAALLALSAPHLWDHARLLAEYVPHEPRRELDQLARVLVERRIEYVYADYWTAYDVTFMTKRRVIATPHAGGERIRAFTRLLEHDRARAFELTTEPCPGGEPLLRWYLCAPALTQ